MQKLIVAGIGSGSYGQMTRQVIQALEECEVIVGYSVYVDLLRPYFPSKEFLATSMRQEEERCRRALQCAADGHKAVFVCSGDAGVYGMAGLLYEMATEFPGVTVEVLPGVTAAVSGAAMLGAPLVHDFVTISLSDALTPWEVIARRLRCAAEGDFCIVLYNPASHRRKDSLRHACQILLETLPPYRPCGYAENIGREGERMSVCTLHDLLECGAGMFTTVFIGNAATRVVQGRLVTPRGYPYEARE